MPSKFPRTFYFFEISAYDRDSKEEVAGFDIHDYLPSLAELPVNSTDGKQRLEKIGDSDVWRCLWLESYQVEGYPLLRWANIKKESVGIVLKGEELEISQSDNDGNVKVSHIAILNKNRGVIARGSRAPGVTSLASYLEDKIIPDGLNYRLDFRWLTNGDVLDSSSIVKRITMKYFLPEQQDIKNANSSAIASAMNPLIERFGVAIGQDVNIEIKINATKRKPASSLLARASQMKSAVLGEDAEDDFDAGFKKMAFQVLDGDDDIDLCATKVKYTADVVIGSDKLSNSKSFHSMFYVTAVGFYKNIESDWDANAFGKVGRIE